LYLDPNKPLSDSLADFVKRSSHGTRLPTVRELMREYGVGQATVQKTISIFRDKGLITATAGRGTYVVKPAEGRPEQAVLNPKLLDSLLFLSNSSMNERCARVQSALVNQVKSMGGKAVQISYHDTDHLMDVLRTVPRFDAAVLQTHYELIPIRLLSIFQTLARAIAVDGHTVSGIDVDRMGIDWEEAMSLALTHLTDRGHERIALVTLNSPSQPILAARRFFARFDNWKGQGIQTRIELLDGPVHPSDSVEDAFGRILDEMSTGQPDAPTAQILLGVSDGAGVVSALGKRNLRLSVDLDLVLLGHTDVTTEHMNTLTIAGGRCADGSKELMRILLDRLKDPGAPPKVVYIPTEIRESAG